VEIEKMLNDKTILITGGTGFCQGKMTRMIGRAADVCL